MRRVGAPGHQAASYGICHISSTLSGSWEAAKTDDAQNRHSALNPLSMWRLKNPDYLG